MQQLGHEVQQAARLNFKSIAITNAALRPNYLQYHPRGTSSFGQFMPAGHIFRFISQTLYSLLNLLYDISNFMGFGWVLLLL